MKSEQERSHIMRLIAERRVFKYNLPKGTEVVSDEADTWKFSIQCSVIIHSLSPNLLTVRVKSSWCSKFLQITPIKSLSSSFKVQRNICIQTLMQKVKSVIVGDKRNQVQPFISPTDSTWWRQCLKNRTQKTSLCPNMVIFYIYKLTWCSITRKNGLRNQKRSSTKEIDIDESP